MAEKRCQAETYCKLFPNCPEPYCINHIKLQYLYDESGMPLKYQYPAKLTPCDADLTTFRELRDWVDTVEAHVASGDGLLLVSPNKGNGKTTWACKAMNQYFRRIAWTNGMDRCRGLFVNVPQFFEELRASMDDETYAEIVSAKKRAIYEADLVIWDDIGTETPTKWVREQLYLYINYRESNLLSQIFTSNLTVEAMEKDDCLGERIVSRIMGSCTVYTFNDAKDWRREK